MAPVNTIRDYLRKIEPRQFDGRGRPKVVAESRLKVFAAVKEALIRAGQGTYRQVVAATVAAADRHGADTGDVWRLVRRGRALANNREEQLKLKFD